MGVGNHPYFIVLRREDEGVTTLYFIRHGQAGPPDDYDRLSPLGERQASLLGAYFAAREISFETLLAGGLKRQQETARLVAAELASSSREVTTDERWNEFSLLQVYRELALRLREDSPEFARDLEEMTSAVKLDPHTTRGAAGRCDRAVIEAWMENRYPDATSETWDDFRGRVRSAWESLAGREPDERIAIFTSATPIAIGVGMSLSLSHQGILRLMAVLFNSSLTVIKLRQGEPLLISFNMTPHLHEPSMVTYR